MRHSSARERVDYDEPAPFPQSRAEYLYRFLDNRIIQGCEGRWRVCVYSVSESGGHFWVQMAVKGPGVHSVLMRVGESSDPSDALEALEAWLVVPQFRDDRVISVSGSFAGSSRDGYESSSDEESAAPPPAH